MLLRRALALALTVTMMSAPLALAVCHVECADASAGRDQTAHHSCHGSTEPGTVAMSAVPHVCGHTDEAPLAGLERAQQSVIALVAVVPSTVWSPVRPARAVHAPTAADTSPPTSQRPTQLRI